MTLLLVLTACGAGDLSPDQFSQLTAKFKSLDKTPVKNQSFPGSWRLLAPQILSIFSVYFRIP